MTGMETQNVPACIIDGGPLFEEALLATTKANNIATVPAHTWTRRTKCFVRLACISERILFAVLSKREVYFGRGSVCISMNVGN
jgi:hypothetical protein